MDRTHSIPSTGHHRQESFSVASCPPADPYTGIKVEKNLNDIHLFYQGHSSSLSVSSGEDNDSCSSATSATTVSTICRQTTQVTKTSATAHAHQDLSSLPKTSKKLRKVSDSGPYPRGEGKVRRLQANARERKRMHGLKEAFDLLREHLPAWANDRQMSKYDTLLMAQTYIVRLQEILADQAGKDSS